MKFYLQCTYCGYRWTEMTYNKASLQNKRCPNGTCKDRNLIIKDASEEIDYYQGCPPFPEKKKKDDYNIWIDT